MVTKCLRVYLCPEAFLKPSDSARAEQSAHTGVVPRIPVNTRKNERIMAVRMSRPNQGPSSCLPQIYCCLLLYVMHVPAPVSEERCFNNLQPSHLAFL